MVRSHNYYVVVPKIRMNNALIEKVCNDCETGVLSSVPLSKLREYKTLLDGADNPYPQLPKWKTRIPDTLDIINAIIREKEDQESRDFEHLSLSRSARCISIWALIASIFAIAITTVPVIIKATSKPKPPVKNKNQGIEPTPLDAGQTSQTNKAESAHP